DQAHGVARRAPALEAHTKPPGIRKGGLLPVARGTSDGVVAGKPRVVEQHASQRRPMIGEGVVGRSVVELSKLRLFERSRQSQVRVLVWFSWQQRHVDAAKRGAQRAFLVLLKPAVLVAVETRQQSVATKGIRRARGPISTTG